MKTQTIGAFDAKTHLSELLTEVEKGCSFEITRRGKPVARLVPAEETEADRSVEAVVTVVRELRTKYRITHKDIEEWRKEGRKR
ncbi:MAG: type II toxin-antitoxin system prevent-host-death family antitoxin [Verrucomicrobia bacterium]|nr:type II toxin-antitoxin system prevent-host-death family antitoxin [Verrucomicrobiota bacterium]